jgi:hypothetical protein
VQFFNTWFFECLTFSFFSFKVYHFDDDNFLREILRRAAVSKVNKARHSRCWPCVCPTCIIALPVALAVRAMNEDTQHRERTDSLGLIWPMYLRWSLRSALDEWDTKLSLSVANTSAHFSGCFWPCPPLGGRYSATFDLWIRHAVLIGQLTLSISELADTISEMTWTRTPERMLSEAGLFVQPNWEFFCCIGCLFLEFVFLISLACMFLRYALVGRIPHQCRWWLVVFLVCVWAPAPCCCCFSGCLFCLNAWVDTHIWPGDVHFYPTLFCGCSFFATFILYSFIEIPMCLYVWSLFT